MDKIVQIAQYLTDRDLTLSVAESCTGGLISSLFTDIEGASKFIEQNFVTYHESSKIKLLGVKPKTLDDFGVISKQVATEMASGLISKYNADFALSTTGVLGPNAMQFEDKLIEVGTCFIGVATRIKSKIVYATVEYKSGENSRIAVKNDIANFAIELLYELIHACA